MEHLMSMSDVEKFKEDMIAAEKSKVTIEKYLRDVKAFLAWLGDGTAVCKETVIEYKNYLTEHYTVTSVNSMLAAVNSFLKNMEWYDCVVKSLRVQREAFRAKERELSREEYYRLLHTAKNRGNQRLYFVMQSICATGIWISELKYITVEALQTGRAVVTAKGKIRTVLLPSELCRQLKQYVREVKISAGSVFVTRNGKPLDRSNVLHDMKKLCEDAGVAEKKVFPHNLRHLFACTYYQAEKDLSHLADLLGHSNVNTTRIYTLVSGDEHARQIEQLGLII